MLPGRTEEWWANLNSGKMDPNEWKSNLRMSKDDFLELVETIRPYQVRTDVISLEKRVAITLYYLKDQGSMRLTANAFGIARCTVGQVVYEICAIITTHLGPSLIRFPTGGSAFIDISIFESVWVSTSYRVH